MKIMTNKKIDELEEKKYLEGFEDAEKHYKKPLEQAVSQNKIYEERIKKLEKMNFDLDGEKQDLLKDIKKLEKKIEDLKVNVREAYSTVTEEQVQATAKAIVDESKTKKKSVKKVIDEIVEESKNNIPDNRVKMITDDLSEDVDTSKNKELYDKVVNEILPKAKKTKKTTTKKEKIDITKVKDTKKKSIKGRKVNAK